MSLLLRNETQDILDEYNLSEYHCEVCALTKILIIVTECGKPFCRVQGVKFSKQNPSIMERGVAVTLLTEFLLKYKKEIEDTLKAKKLLMEVTKVNTENTTSSVTKKVPGYARTTFSLSLKNLVLILRIVDTEKGAHKFWFNSLEEFLDIGDFPTKSEIKKAQKVLVAAKDLHLKYEKIKEEYNKCVGLLNTCSI